MASLRRLKGRLRPQLSCPWWELQGRGLGGHIERTPSPSVLLFLPSGDMLANGCHTVSNLQTSSSRPKGRERSGSFVLSRPPCTWATMRTSRVQTTESPGQTLSGCVPLRRAWWEGRRVWLAEFQDPLPLPCTHPLEHGWVFKGRD